MKSKAVTQTIKASIKISAKLHNCYYVVEYGEERILPEKCDAQKEREALWDLCYDEVFNQLEAQKEVNEKPKKKKRNKNR